MRPLGRPEGPADSIHTTRTSNVGDAREPLAGVRVLKGRQAGSTSPLTGGTRDVTVGKQGNAAVSANPLKSVSVQNSAATINASSRQLHLEGIAGRLAKTLHLPADADTFLALSAMVGEKLGLQTDSILAIRRFIKRHDGDPAAARLAARALAVGLDPDGPEAEALVRMVENPADDSSSGFAGNSGEGLAGESGEDAADAGQDHGQDGGQDAGQPEHDAPQDGMLDIAAAENFAEEIPGIMKAFMRAAAEACAINGISQLCTLDRKNLEASGSSGFWVCVPFAVPVHDVDFHGFMRIWYDGKAARAARLVADIRCGQERRLLTLTGEGSNAEICYHTDSLAEQDAFSAEFGKRWKVSSMSMLEGDLAELAAMPGVYADA